MKNFRKDQMRLAVLLELGKDNKKNSDIIKGAEKRLVLDEAYNKLMQNGKQTIGNKELQFILYYIKRDKIADIPYRGIYTENTATKIERTKIISDIINTIDNKKVNTKEIMLNDDTLKQIRELAKVEEMNDIGLNAKKNKDLLTKVKKADIPKSNTDTKDKKTENKTVLLPPQVEKN